MTDQTVTLNAGDKEYSYPRLNGSVGPDVVDIRKMYGQTGMFTYDPGFTSTASCQSAITYIDGDEGILLHRGYPIDQLAEQSTFMEVSLSPPSRGPAQKRRTRRIRPDDHLSHDGPRAAGDLPARFPQGRSPDGDHVRRRRRTCRPFTMTAPTSPTRSSA